MSFSIAKFLVYTTTLLSVVKHNRSLDSVVTIEKEYSNLADQRIVIIGETGVGKSSLANVLMGRSGEYDGTNFTSGCFKVAWQGKGDRKPGEVVTTATCPDTGHWLGIKSNPRVTVIDTPGFGDEMKEEQKTINGLVEVLKKIEYVNVFVIAFREGDTRITSAMLSMLNLFQQMFGKNFWKNAILEATHWNHNSVNQRRRLAIRPPKTEENWTNQFNGFFTKELEVTKKLEAVFIDSHHLSNPNDEFFEPVEVQKFTENTNKLLDVAQTNERFYTKDIEEVLPELSKLQNQYNSITHNNAQLQKDIDALAISTDIANGEIEKLTEELKMVPPPGFTTSSFSGFGVGMCVLGVCIGFIVKGLVSKTQYNIAADGKSDADSIVNLDCVEMGNESNDAGCKEEHQIKPFSEDEGNDVVHSDKENEISPA